jgi:hypothetical protein
MHSFSLVKSMSFGKHALYERGWGEFGVGMDGQCGEFFRGRGKKGKSAPKKGGI